MASEMMFTSPNFSKLCVCVWGGGGEGGGSEGVRGHIGLALSVCRLSVCALPLYVLVVPENGLC